MRAVAGPLDQFAPGQQRLDFCAGQRIACFDGGLARHHVENFVQQLFFMQVEQFLFTLFQQLADEVGRVEALEKRGRAPLPEARRL